jgi:enterochelin esterase family protein
MKKIILPCLIFLLIQSASFSQIQFQNFISYLYSLGDSAKNAKIDSFINYHQSRRIPIVEDNYAIFIYRGSASSVAVAGDMNGWSSSSATMNKVAGTTFFYYSRTFELNARIDYKLVINGSTWVLDPLNPNTCTGGYGPNSELAMPNYIQPWEINYKPAIPHGVVLQSSLQSTNTGTTFNIKIYLPPNYNDTSKKFATVYFQDGFEYIELAKVVNVLDNLIDSGKIIPVIGVFVKPNNRNEEYAGSVRNQYRLFFVNELVPWIDGLYRTIKNPQNRLVLGDSYGGNISALICYNHPDVFGNCGVHSGAFQPNSYEAYNLIVNGPYKNIRWTSIWGTYESLWQNMRNFRDNLINKGYQFKWIELPEGHSWGLWRATIDVILENIFPANPVNVEKELKIDESGFSLFQNFPNPFNPTTKIQYAISSAQFVTLKIFNLLGCEIVTLVNERKQAGIYEVNFSSKNLPCGIYFYSLSAGGLIKTKQMVIVK